MQLLVYTIDSEHFGSKIHLQKATHQILTGFHPSPIMYLEFIIEFSFKIFMQHMHPFCIYALSKKKKLPVKVLLFFISTLDKNV